MAMPHEGSNFEVTVDINISQYWYNNRQGGMQLRENFRIPAANFSELAKILGEFHDLARRIESEKCEPEPSTITESVT